MAKRVLLVLAALLLSGCATIVGEQSQTVYLESQPAGAQFVVSDNHGVVKAQGVTPQYITLPKSDSSYFGRLTYTATFKLADHELNIVPLESRLNSWYTFGNLLFLGVPGWLVVDPFNGAMYTLYPAQIHAIMQPCPRGPWRHTCV